MRDIIVDRCCGNCEWSISPDNEEDIMLENSYEEDDPTRPRAGDCCLGMEHDANYVCSCHDYLSVGLETYVFYDNKDIEDSYYVVNTYYDHIIKYFKLYRNKEQGIYNYGIRVIDLYPVKSDLVNGVSFEIEKYQNQAFYNIITNFAYELNNGVIWDNDRKCFMSVNIYEHSTGLYFTGCKDYKFVDVRVNNDDEKIYKLIEELFNNMSLCTSDRINEDVYTRILSINK